MQLEIFLKPLSARLQSASVFASLQRQQSATEILSPTPRIHYGNPPANPRIHYGNPPAERPRSTTEVLPPTPRIYYGNPPAQFWQLSVRDTTIKECLHQSLRSRKLSQTPRIHWQKLLPTNGQNSATEILLPSQRQEFTTETLPPSAWNSLRKSSLPRQEFTTILPPNARNSLLSSLQRQEFTTKSSQTGLPPTPSFTRQEFTRHLTNARNSLQRSSLPTPGIHY
ncbi:hypothetical protein DEU56DRAFT_919513 [Suillus clintonianus]|uniref:uncharacterized protein n=1 Tax=Suillus clintonianus TaxID=1904413 RepID=UPI001B85E725|nr:uncharacterized protein DEU56DRAFT_919513 [Suillus clintonianus]KAG2114819.1 hypothetical protein DEU56DRAFT_919513 [Suillus clintonianus]